MHIFIQNSKFIFIMRLYQIDILIAEKALAEDKKQSEVIQELASYLGISTSGLKIIREKRVSEKVRISSRLLKIADFFDCQIDDLLNPLAKDLIPTGVEPAK